MHTPRAWLLRVAIGLVLSPAAGATVDPPKVQETDPPASANAPAFAPAAVAPPPAAQPIEQHQPQPAEGERVDCDLAMEAAPLLREASSRGIQPRAVGGVACDMSPADNRFFGPGGDAPCKLQFDNAAWLKPGMRFTSMTGVGTFEARTSGAGVDVTIPPDGGVRFQRVTVRTSVRRPATCPTPQPRSVLAD
jgi:hypothetical protein